MTTFTVELDSGTALFIAQTIFLVVVAFMAYRLSRIPAHFVDKFSRSIANIAREAPEGEAFLQLSEALTKAWSRKDWAELLPLVGNPIVHKAWINLQSIIPGVTRKEGGGYAGD